MRKILLMVLLFASVSVALADQTTRRKLRVKPEYNVTATTSMDSIISDSSMIEIAGYDKPLPSHKETFFVTNNYNRSIKSLTVELNYYDMQSRQLHSAVHTISCEIPAGETRQVQIKSWDVQCGFYYYLSSKPRRQATPFFVKQRVLSIVFR